MDLYAQQQFGFFLQTATERYVMRLEERFRGAEPALARARQAPDEFRAGLRQFTDAVFEDFLLNNLAGACFVLQGMAQRQVESAPAGSVESVLVEMSKELFTDLLENKSVEMLEQHASYQSI